MNITGVVMEWDAQRESYARGNTCPSCAGSIPEDTVWVWQTKFYCSETCCRKASGGY